MIPFINVRAQREAYLSEFKQAEQEVLDSGCFIGGPQVQALETELAEFTGAKHAITCGSGTDALTIALLALGLEPEDEVIVPDFTFIAPAECVMRLGGIPKFADIDAETLQISVESIESLIGEKTRGIIAVNLFGQCAPYAEIRKCARANNLWLIEDSAQAFGAMQNGVPACTFGDISITSFYPAKPLGCYGDGGALFTANDELAKKIRLIANHGSQQRYIHEICGMNSRLDALQAAVLRVKLRHFKDELKKRSENASKYNEFFNAVPGIAPQKIAVGNTSTYAQYTVLADDRPAFLKQLENAGVPYCIHYPQPLHTQPCFKGLNQGIGNGNAIEACQKVVSLPMCAFTDVDEIIARLKKVM
ncbi:aminotransferase, DegT/DnrJ/EryC1/StrS family [Fibrobacter succinogenes subsp. succinogenes S85]|uniref:Aminotransferase, DegT/DnrJ/EryC1/StrS family n=1 Tax=Fibrobacter succinogenes (strain ATCC 19169 / S85) TaxID=59374 RepID=C9RJX8_FIBSS|nr:DegT/DnrJ/EryC1/StrS family aminotransferase [Fibrobacter succinogenes]ACX73841.1 DegT/DnrJ/EryC1/StrS aminotransferase [Fibrobacter succinogenes subsp. succinogenes S85]ADL26478.1 aminotransferase, DegT/DnrJ/EryC1/StrS family [Fibrobacter succinogenes subsp. succinogenes S85]